MTLLTPNWELVPLQDISDINPRFKIDPDIPKDLEISFIPMSAVEAQTGVFDLSAIKKLSSVIGKYTPFMNKDILFAKITPCMENGKIALVDTLTNGLGFGSTEFHVVRPIEGIEPKYLFFFLNSETIRQEAKRNMTGAVGQRRVPTKYFSEIPVPLPPLNEQKRIVGKLEELFSDLDAATEDFLKAKKKLQKYRMSILNAAVTGELTKEWREDHIHELEPASVLLERILTERREKWEQDYLEKMKAQGKEPKDDKWKRKYKEPFRPDVMFIVVPECWALATIDQLSDIVQYGTSQKTKDDDQGIPVLRMGNIFNGKITFEKLKYLPYDHEEFPSLLLNAGDVLFNRTNSVELVGKTAVYKGNMQPCSFASYLIRVSLNKMVNPNLISSFINSSYGKLWINEVVSQQVGQANVNGTKLKQLAVPLMSLQEQEIIVNKLDESLSVIENLEIGLTRAETKIESLRQSILKKAFSGQLVSQDPNDEPASVLLERIKAEKEKIGRNKSSNAAKKLKVPVPQEV